MANRRKKFPIPVESIKYVEGNKNLKKVLEKYLIPPDRKQQVYESLQKYHTLKEIEKHYIETKDSLKPTEKINIERLKNGTHTLLAHTSNAFLTDEKKAECKSSLETAINIEKARRGIAGPVKRVAQKRTVAKFLKSERTLRSFTLLIKDLVRILNPVFCNRWARLKEGLIKEKTLQVVTDIINACFPHLHFTPQQVKARFHK